MYLTIRSCNQSVGRTAGLICLPFSEEKSLKAADIQSVGILSDLPVENGC
jgi:hypothetical protein